MKDLQKRIAYLQGLAKGVELEESKEGKLINEILCVMEDMADHILYLKDTQEDLEDYLESMDNDLSEIEEDFYGDEDDEDMVEVTCPNCHEKVYFDSAILDDDDYIEVTCPECDTVVFVNSDEDEDFEDEEDKEDEKE